MLTAIRESDKKKITGAWIEKNNSESYRCEYCHKLVIHHKSDSGEKIGHFKHKAGESHCPNQVKETEEHIRTKLDIFEYINSGWGDKLQLIELEKWICNNTIRPDVYIVTKKNKIAIEVQATALTIDEIKRRTTNYYNNGIAVLWIMPYHHSRFMEFKYQAEGYDEDNGDYGWSYKPYVRLKSMELFLHWAYFKNLLFWEYERVNSRAFIRAQLDRYIGEDVEFRRDGEDHYYPGKTAKMRKTIKYIEFDISFEDFRVVNANEYKVPQSNYQLPKRRLFTIKRENE